eukprot:CAMPEP_0194292246 /NCGR_PEP_ID=MMETSP0169-20130528/45216_1 /TAXON_ID=218684 /ORGANISM="Corethron pennatum, Strain L29A3" /LENGTH=197 /DNA_ID=CAMNT_0039040365 /DNA_START=86 /DNA_END=679 /DNA_ORIENTATION=-
MKRSRPIENLAAMIISDEQENDKFSCFPNFDEESKRKKSKSMRIEESNCESIESNIPDRSMNGPLNFSDVWSNFFSSEQAVPIDSNSCDIHDALKPSGDLIESFGCFRMTEEADLSCWDSPWEFDIRCTETNPVDIVAQHKRSAPIFFKLDTKHLNSMSTMQKNNSATFIQESVVISPELKSTDCSGSLLPAIHLSE